MMAPVVGEVLPAVAWEGFTGHQVRQYAGASGDRNPIHTDTAVARSAGLAGCPVHGMAIVGRFEDFVCRWRNDVWLLATATRFVNPLLVEEAAMMTGRVVAVEDTQPADFVVRILVRGSDDRIVCLSDARVRLGVTN